MWQGCPKELCSGRNHPDFATADSIINFNFGKVGHGLILKHLGIDVGVCSVKLLEEFDKQRIGKSLRYDTKVAKKVRIAKKTAEEKIQRSVLW